MKEKELLKKIVSKLEDMTRREEDLKIIQEMGKELLELSEVKGGDKIRWGCLRYLTKDQYWVNADEMVFILNRETKFVRKDILPPFVSNENNADIPFRHFENMMYYRDNMDDEQHSVNKDLPPNWIK